LILNAESEGYVLKKGFFYYITNEHTIFVSTCCTISIDDFSHLISNKKISGKNPQFNERARDRFVRQ
jgi:hypothetical protein